MKIRDATPDDAPAACEVMRRSITELCFTDHGNDKKPKTFRSWIRLANSLRLAVENDTILAVGCVTADGEITLNYVSPDARFRGVSKALLAELERHATDQGNAVCRLESTETARRFYLAPGYTENGFPNRKCGTVAGYPMSKRLGPA